MNSRKLVRKKRHRQIDGHLVQQGRHAPRAEQLLGRTTGAAEGAGQAAALAGLQQDHRAPERNRSGRGR